MEIKAKLPAVPPTNAGSALFPAAVGGVLWAMPKPVNNPQGVAQPQSREATPQQLQQTVDELQRKVQITAPNLQFSIDHDTGRTVVKVIDADTNEVIRQIPDEEILRLAKEIDRVQGLLLHKQG
ncbi:MAG: flagellar protein FlaG [Sterolibacterium sp.]|nr:flagellar protein FlaG [Sterolibacterium sp.]